MKQSDSLHLFRDKPLPGSTASTSPHYLNLAEARQLTKQVRGFLQRRALPCPRRWQRLNFEDASQPMS